MKNITTAALLTALLFVVPRARAAAETAAVDVADREAETGRQWKEKLGLSAEQLPKFLAAVKARDADLQPLRERLREGMRKLQSQLAAGVPEKDVQETLDQLGQVRKDISARNDRFDGGLTSLLAPSQRAKLLVWRSLGALPGKSDQGLEADGIQEPEAEAEPE